MGIETEKFIRKPLYVDAVRVSVANFDEIAAWCQGEIEADEVPGQGTKRFIKVRVHNPKNPRQTKAFVGDWLLYTERGYKVYTNKAFHMSFDLVSAEMTAEEKAEFQGSPSVETAATPQILKLWIDPESGELTEASPHKHAVPLTLEELMNIVRNELVEDEPKSPDEPETKMEVHSVGPVAENPSPETGVNPIEVLEDGAVYYPQPTAAEGKRILSMEEQRTMSQDDIRELLRSGEVALEQDLAESSQV